VRRGRIVVVSFAIAACGLYGVNDGTQPGVGAPDGGDEHLGDDASGDDADRPADAADQDASDAAIDAAGTKGPFFVFISSIALSIDDVATADAKCQALAGAAGVAGSFSAWVSYSGSPASMRVTGAGPWRDKKGNTIFVSRADLLSGRLATALQLDEKGANFVDQIIWTGTNATGGTGANCNDWVNTGGTGVVGAAGELDSRWTENLPTLCNIPHPVYCFQHP
jgi:hypothetical protein